MIKKTKIRKAFNQSGVQITNDALDYLEDEMNRKVHKWINRCKDNNIKRLTIELVWAALGQPFR
jgi:hypothetical protein